MNQVNNSLFKELNEREQSILMLIGDGLTNDEIAQKMSLTLNTVKWYIKNIFLKLNVKNRTQAANLVRKQGKYSPQETNPEQLPHPLSDFVGRKIELELLGKFFADRQERLITLLGLGGMGKTTLAIQAAHQGSHLFKDGVFFISLAAVSSPSRVFREIASAFGLNQSNSEPLTDLISYLRRKQLLLILDNFEHLTELGAELVTILEQAPRLKILVTSREVLNVRGERIFPLQGLSTEDIHGEAVKLFEQLARRNTTDFHPDYPEIWNIVQLTGGLPLAIELASTWVEILPIKKIREQIQNNMDLLTSEAADLAPRHRSLEAVMNYTWETLTPTQKKVLSALAVFESGFTYETAEALTQVSPKVFRQLLQKSLLRPAGDYHFRLHTLIRQFVLAQMSDEQRRHGQLNHAHYYLHELQREVKGLNDRLELQLHSHLMMEQENLFQAWQTFLAYEEMEDLREMLDLGYWMDMASWWQEGVELIQATLAQVTDPILQGRLYFIHTLLSFRLNDLPNVMTYGQQSRPLLINTPYQEEAAVAFGITAIFETIFTSAEKALETIQISYDLLTDEIHTRRPLVKWVLRSFEGSIYMFTGDTHAVIDHFEAILSAVPDSASWLVNILHVNLGEAYLINGQPDMAKIHLTKGYQKGIAAKDAMVALGSVYYLTHIDGRADFAIKLNELVNFFGSSVLLSRVATYLGSFALIRQQIQFAQDLLVISLKILFQNEDQTALATQANLVVDLLPNPELTAHLTNLRLKPFDQTAWQTFFDEFFP